MPPCKVCRKEDSQKPQINRGDDWCCEDHRKMIADEEDRNPLWVVQIPSSGGRLVNTGGTVAGPTDQEPEVH